jgi:hypothetical protein
MKDMSSRRFQASIYDYPQITGANREDTQGMVNSARE